jgi:hypothetical protein
MLNQELRHYLRQVCGRIKNRRQRWQVYRELRSHLQDQVAALLAENFTEKEAIARVLKQAEHPKKLGHKLEIARKPFVLRHPIFSGSVFTVGLSLVALIVVADRATQTIMNNAANGAFENRDAIYQAFEDDLKYLDQELNDNDWQRTSNAHNFIQKNLQKYSASEKKSIHAILNVKSKPSYEEAYHFAQSHNIHLDWLEDLAQYDYWNFMADDTIRERLQKAGQSNSIEKIGQWASLSVPDYSLFSDLLKLNVLRHRKHPHAAQAALEIYVHAARLSGSTSTLVGQVTAASMFRSADSLAKFAGVKKDYSRLAKIGQAYKRVSWGWAHVVRTQVFAGNVSPRWEPYIKYKLGLCAGVSENAVAVEGIGDFLYPSTLLEKDLSEDLNRSKQVLGSLIGICGIEEFNSFQIRSPASSLSPFWGKETIELWSMIEPKIAFVPNPSRLPFVRRIFANYMLSTAVPDYMSGAYSDVVSVK